MHELLEQLGLRQILQHGELRFFVDVWRAEGGLDALPQPRAALTLGDVQRLEADGATEDGAQSAEDFAKRRLLHTTKAPRRHHPVEIVVRKAVVRRIELGVRLADQLAEWIDLRLEVACLAVGVDERIHLREARLVAVRATFDEAADGVSVAMAVGAIRVTAGDSVAVQHRRCWRVDGDVAAPTLEEATPARIDARRIFQELFVELVQKCSVLGELEEVIGHCEWDDT